MSGNQKEITNKLEEKESSSSETKKEHQGETGDNEEEELTLESIIDDFFQFADQRRRFKTDISVLMEQASDLKMKVELEHSPNDLSVVVGLITNKFDFCSTFSNQELINFEIHVSQKYYPQKGTKITCKTPFLSPCLCDGRDYLQDILGHAWHYQVTLTETAQQIIEFVREVVRRKTDSLYLQRLGKYYLGLNYFYDDIKQFSALTRIPCVQFEDNFFVKLHIRIIGITDAHFLIFDAEEAEKKVIKLLFWSDLQSLVEIRRRKDEGNKLTFKWKNYDRSLGASGYFEQTFQINEPEYVLQQILKKMQKFQPVRIWSNSYVSFGQQWDTKRQEIEQQTQLVVKYEEAIKHKFNIENVQKLIDAYNDVIEHYSAVNDYLSEIFLNSLHNLLNRPDVQCLLNYEQSENSKKRSASNEASDASPAAQVKLVPHSQSQKEAQIEDLTKESSQKVEVHRSKSVEESKHDNVQSQKSQEPANNKQEQKQTASEQQEKTQKENLKDKNDISNDSQQQQKPVAIASESDSENQKDSENQEQVQIVDGEEVVIPKQEASKSEEEENQHPMQVDPIIAGDKSDLKQAAEQSETNQISEDNLENNEPNGQ